MCLFINSYIVCIYILYILYIPVVPARGGAKVASGIYDKDLLIYRELACAVRQPGQRVRALCEAVAALLSKNMTCARPRCNATPSKDFLHTSHFTLHTCTSHFTLHTCTSHSTLHFESLFKRTFKGKITTVKIQKIC